MNLSLLVPVSVLSESLSLHWNIKQTGCRHRTDTTTNSAPTAIPINVSSTPQLMFQVRIVLAIVCVNFEQIYQPTASHGHTDPSDTDNSKTILIVTGRR